MELLIAREALLRAKRSSLRHHQAVTAVLTDSLVIRLVTDRTVSRVTSLRAIRRPAAPVETANPLQAAPVETANLRQSQTEITVKNGVYLFSRNMK